MFSSVFCSPFLLCSDSEEIPVAQKFPARWGRALPGGPQLQGSLQSPAVFLASDLLRPDFPPAQPCWQETRQSSPGLLRWFCWSYWKNKWVIDWFGQVGKLRPGQLPGVFCEEPALLLGGELCEEQVVMASCRVNQAGRTPTPGTSRRWFDSSGQVWSCRHPPPHTAQRVRGVITAASTRLHFGGDGSASSAVSPDLAGPCTTSIFSFCTHLLM